MSVFFIRAWVDGSDIVAVRTGEGQIDTVGNYGTATYIDAVSPLPLVDAGTLRPTLTYANNQLTSSLVTIYPAKDVTSPLAQSGFAGQSVYNWSDENFYQWNGNPWDSVVSPGGVGKVIENEAESLFTEQGLFFIKDVDTLPASGDFVGQKVFNRADGKLYEWDGTAWVLVVAAVEAVDISGQLITNQIALDAITNDLIANNAVQTENIANLAVNADKIANLSITTTKITDDAITTPKIAANAVTATEIAAGSIITSKLAAGAVTATTIASSAITTDKIGAGQVTALKIAAGTITANEIAANTITGNKIAANTITGANIAANTITADDIQANTITGGLLATSGIITNSAQINNALISTAKIQDLAVNTLKIGNNAATVADFDQYNPTLNSGNFISGAGMTTPLNACFAGVSIPANVTADIFLSANFRHGYLSTPTQWGFRIRRAIGASVVTLTTRTGMTATADFPVVTYLTTYTTGGSSVTIYVDVDWYGQNSNIELQDATLSLVARYK